ncbi:MAG: EutN/CcmL family microcompartment protein, partial [bacterium]|nr:EutN/CcmL family microcompartment protein [bacterium]
MFIAKVIGNVWATKKHKSLENLKLLLVKQYDFVNKKTIGDAILAVETPNSGISSGPGDIVLVMDEGNSARQILNDQSAPIRTIIVG